ncbi:MAG TPA: hypothetical protein VFI30_06320 [Nocardioidaceae bacterium]|nr:hypothetical protein [Nocardioidaceae bacterium]
MLTRRRARQQLVSAQQQERISAAVAAVTAARDRLDAVLERGAPLAERQSARAELRSAYLAADALVRPVVEQAKSAVDGRRMASYVTWSEWRRLLSRIDATGQAGMFADQDDLGVLPTNGLEFITRPPVRPAVVTR